MFKKQHLALAIAATLAAANAQAFNAESFTVSGYVKNETAALTKDGTFNGQETGPTDTTKYNDSGDLIKSETSVKLFVNGDVGEGSSMHAELLLHNDSKAKGSHFKNSDSYTQSEFLRELYVDTQAGDWDVRLGKQQIVWGKADGAKFLDLINPTDYREMAQNVMAESRIPTWGALFDKYTEDGGNIQIAITQPRENVFAGLNRDVSTAVRSSGTNLAGHDAGNPFILKGVDTITGKVNGFLAIAPDLGAVASGFYGEFGANKDVDGDGAWGGIGDTVDYGRLQTFTSTTVGAFAATPEAWMTTAGVAYGAYQSIYGVAATIDGNGGDATGADVLKAFTASHDTNLTETTLASNGLTVTGWGTNKNTAFEYMGDATFATFDAFVGATSQYVYKMPDDTDVDLAFRYANSTSNGVNYSAIYSYNYDKNPVIDLSWRNTSGGILTQNIDSTSAAGYHTISLTDSSGTYGGYADAGTSQGAAVLTFEESLRRAHNIGGGLDFAIDTDSMGPVVIRAEGLYQKDVYSPIVDLGRIGIGDLINGLKMVPGDRFKYVIGADVTALTDMMVSVQFIQDRNLDFVDGSSQITSGLNFSSDARYTADFASMHLTNGFKKAEKNKEFYSIFLSKPFGDSGEGRWNNILMLEEGGGRWNRFDVEYSLSNDLIGTIEYNKYWGDDNTQFGQLEAASNVQVGLKYLFE